MDALPYYKWYWIDYRANRKVQRMSWQARGLYRELLDEFWSEGTLPNDTHVLADICGCDHTTFMLHWPQIEGCWEETQDGLINAKMDAQRTEVDSSRVAKAKAGAKGGKTSNSFTRGKQVKAEAKQVLTEIPSTDNKGVEALAKQVQAQPDIAEQSRAEHKQEQSREARSLATAVLISPEKLARQVQERTGLLTEGCYRVLTAVIRREQNSGIPSDLIVSTLADEWQEYQRAGPELAVTFGAEKFFGEGKWKDREGWGWRTNGTSREHISETRNDKILREALAGDETPVKATGGHDRGDHPVC